MFDAVENEHQELFYRKTDLTRPLAVHIPSPLGPLPYYFYAKVRRSHSGRLGGVEVRFDLEGLRPTHVLVPAGAGAPTPAAVPSSDPEYVWHCVCRAPLARGDGTMIANGWPAETGPVDVLLCTWPRYVTSGEADRRLALWSDPSWAPSGVPLGGIGCGRVDICRDGRFRNFSMNNNQDAPDESVEGLPGAYLALSENGHVVDLATKPVAPGRGSVAELVFQPRFPQAILSAQECLAGIDVKVLLSGALCPHDLRTSCMPAFIVRWEVCNASPRTRRIECRMGWPNLIGLGGGLWRRESGTGYGDGTYHYWNDETGRKVEPVRGDGWVALRYTGEPAPQFLPSAGEHWLGVAGCRKENALIESSPARGEIGVSLEIPAGRTATATMIFVAAMPHWVDSLGVERGHLWQNHWPSGREMFVELVENHERILAKASELSALLDDSSLPDWLRRRLCNCMYPLVTNSVLYRDGRFSINEGPTEMSGCYGTMDQRLGAHPATQLFFPELNARELGQFAAIQGPKGDILHDLGGGHLERQPGDHSWPDLTCSFILQTARHAWSCGDAAFAEKMWPVVRRAAARHAMWAEEGRGVAQVGKGLGTSYDSYHYIGTTGYIATLWLATLAVAERWARETRDADLLERIPNWRRAALDRLETDLWNGSYYIAYGNAEGIRRETSHAGQLAGQVFARLLAGCDAVPAERAASCAAALLRLNGSRRYAVPPDETDADGKEVSAFGWLPYVEAFMLTAAAFFDRPGVWQVWKRMARAMDDDAHPCDTRLMYRPLTGEPSWGAWYMTAPASWLVYDAILDFFHDEARHSFRLGTPVPGKYPLVHPLFWATADVAADGNVTVTVKKHFSQNPATVCSIELPDDCLSVEIGGRRAAQGERRGRYIVWPLAEPARLEAGAQIAWRARRSRAGSCA